MPVRAIVGQDVQGRANTRNMLRSFGLGDKDREMYGIPQPSCDVSGASTEGAVIALFLYVYVPPQQRPSVVPRETSPVMPPPRADLEIILYSYTYLARLLFESSRATEIRFCGVLLYRADKRVCLFSKT